MGSQNKNRTLEAWDQSESRPFFWFLYTIAQILMIGALTLVLFWVFNFHQFAWKEDPANEFYYHPVLMIGGFVFLMGQGMLMYRSLDVCVKYRFIIKLAHTICHILAIPAIVLGFLTVLDSHNLREQPIPNFYSLHSWVGLVAIGLFAIQFVIGFFSFMILLCCEASTEAYRSALVPIHSTLGLVTFILALIAAISGLNEKAIFSIKKGGILYSMILDNPNTESGFEGIIMNTLGAVLIGLAIVIPLILRVKKGRYQPVQVLESRENSGAKTAVYSF